MVWGKGSNVALVLASEPVTVHYREVQHDWRSTGSLGRSTGGEGAEEGPNIPEGLWLGEVPGPLEKHRRTRAN